MPEDRANANAADQMGYPVLPNYSVSDSASVNIPRGVAISPSIHYGEPVSQGYGNPAQPRQYVPVTENYDNDQRPAIVLHPVPVAGDHPNRRSGLKKFCVVAVIIVTVAVATRMILLLILSTN